MKHGKVAALVTAVMAVGGGVAAVQASAFGSHAGDATVKATLIEWKMTLSAKQVPAGKVTFVVHNAGLKEHEFVVIRTNRAPNALPVKAYKASEVGSQGEIGEFGAGLTKKLTLTLKPGKYVLICNIAKHYGRGQRAGLVVR